MAGLAAASPRSRRPKGSAAAPRSAPHEEPAPFRLIVAAVLGLICLGAVVAFFLSGGPPSASGGTLPFVSMDRRWPSAVALVAILAVFLVMAMGRAAASPQFA